MDGDREHKAPFTDVELRAYFASVVGQFRQPFGKRGGGPVALGNSKVLAQNGTKDRILSVTVGRSDVTGAGTTVIFSQNQAGAASNNDFVVQMAGTTRERFVLYPGDQLSVQVLGPIQPVFAVGQETF